MKGDDLKLTVIHRALNYTRGIELARYILSSFYDEEYDIFCDLCNKLRYYSFTKLYDPQPYTVLHDYIDLFVQNVSYFEEEINFILHEVKKENYKQAIDSFKYENGIDLTGYREPDYDNVLICKSKDHEKCNCHACVSLSGYLELIASKYFEGNSKAKDAAWHILMNNRYFLRDFHERLGEFIKENLDELINRYPDCFDINRRIKRKDYWKKWIRNGIIHRDRAKCVIRREDLSYELSTDPDPNIDHIVALDKFGTNDPTNLQLLCKKCNLEKSTKSTTTDWDIPLWDLDEDE